MDTVWGLAGSIGMFLLNTFISDLAKRTAMARSWNQWIANRQLRADATVELKTNLDEQTADLDQRQRELEGAAKPKEKQS